MIPCFSIFLSIDIVFSKDMLSEYRAGRMSAVNDFPTTDAVLHIICSSTESDVSFERIMFFIEDGIEMLSIPSALVWSTFFPFLFFTRIPLSIKFWTMFSIKRGFPPDVVAIRFSNSSLLLSRFSKDFVSIKLFSFDSGFNVSVKTFRDLKNEFKSTESRAINTQNTFLSVLVSRRNWISLYETSSHHWTSSTIIINGVVLAALFKSLKTREKNICCFSVTSIFAVSCSSLIFKPSMFNKNDSHIMSSGKFSLKYASTISGIIVSKKSSGISINCLMIKRQQKNAVFDSCWYILPLRTWAFLYFCSTASANLFARIDFPIPASPVTNAKFIWFPIDVSSKDISLLNSLSRPIISFVLLPSITS